MTYNFNEIYENAEVAIKSLSQNGAVLVTDPVAEEIISNDASLAWAEYPIVDDNGYKIDWVGKSGGWLAILIAPESNFNEIYESLY